MDMTKDFDSSVTFIRGLQSEYELSGIPLKDRKGTQSINERHLEINFVLSLHESIDALKIIDFDDFYIRNSLTGNRYLIPERCGYLNGTTNLTADEKVACPYTVRPFTVKRKNSLFFSSEDGMESALKFGIVLLIMKIGSKKTLS